MDQNGTVMEWWETLEPVHRAMAVILAAVTVGMAIMAFLVSGNSRANADAIDLLRQVTIEATTSNTRRINELERSLDTIRADMSLVRCWARAEIQGTNAAECLVIDARRRSGG